MDKETTSLLEALWPYSDTKGANEENPFIIVALLLARTLGDFVDQCLFAANVAGQFEHAHLHVYFREDRPYKRDIVSMMPNVRGVWRVRGENSIPLDAFDEAFGRPIVVPTDKWYQNKCQSADLVLTPRMMRRAALPGFKELTHLRLPPESTEALDARFRASGVDPERWFCVMHYREANYGLRRAEENRDLEPGDAVEMARYVIEELGGQVVRIGHKEMTPFPDLAGFVDLAAEDDPLLLHAYAVSRARFFLELSSSGPASFAWALGVPALRCNCVNLVGPIDEKSMVLPKHIIRPDGTRMTVPDAIDAHAISDVAMREVLEPKGYKYEANSMAELKAASRDIYAGTADCPCWRPAPPSHSGNLSNRVVLPPVHDYRHKILDYGDLDNRT